MSVTYSLEDTLRRHDMAVYEWLGALRMDYGIDKDVNELLPVDRNNIPVLRVLAGPDRVVAKTVELLVTTGWIAGNDPSLVLASAAALRERAKENFAVLPLPLISIERQDPVPALPDSGVPKVFGRQSFSQASQSWERHQWPGAYETTYRVVFWCAKRYSEVFFREWVYSKLGNIGLGESEALIPVVHEAPWGTIQQRLVFDGSDDESELEGEKNRYFRYGYSFRLRTWHFKKPLGTTSYVHDIAIEERPLRTNESSLDTVSSAPAVAAVSLNLFSFYLTSNLVPTQWPRAGNSTVMRLENPERMRVTCSATTDEVLLSNRALPLDLQGRAIMSIAFDYTSTAPTRVLVASRDPGIEPVSWITNRRFDLPTKTRPSRAQFFALLKQPIFSVTATGGGTPATLYLSNISIRHVRTINRTVPASSAPGGGGTVHAWTGLASRAYLVVVSLATGAASGTVLVGSDSYPVNPALQVGLVALVTPNGTLNVTVPSAVTTDDVYVIPYGGAWRGTDV